MTIQLPHELEGSLKAAVNSGQFASVDDAMAAAVRLLLREINGKPASSSTVTESDTDPVLGCLKDDDDRKLAALPAAGADPDADPLLGLWRDYADEMDEIVANAYRRRREEKWREFDL